MLPLIEKVAVKEKREIFPGMYEFILEGREISSYAHPGQFVEIDTGDAFFLRRPFSIQNADDDNLEILVKVVGRGTEALVKREEEWNLMGPLGRGFKYRETDSALMVGGGVGIAPLKFLYKRITGRAVRYGTLSYAEPSTQKSLFELAERKRIRFLVGARTAGEIPLHKNDPLRQEAIIATDDGSEGFKGTVVDMLEAQSELWEDAPAIFACGPTPMLKAMYDFIRRRGLAGQFSLESRMACGVGICQGCALPFKEGYRLVCKEGPVFDIDDLNREILEND